MKDTRIDDPLFREAVDAIDTGNMASLELMLEQYPRLVRERHGEPREGYFANPYLLWFVADNPIRVDKLPPNIVAIMRLLITAIQHEAPESLSHQLDYTLGLVATGRIPRESGVQIAMIDTLIDAGAKPGTGLGALAHGNIDAANHLIERGADLTLPVAVCLDRLQDVPVLIQRADAATLETSLVAAAFYGKADMIRLILNEGTAPNVYPGADSGFHSHATALHQAVYSGSLESVKILIEAGADPKLTDLIYQGTPLGWALHVLEDGEILDEAKKKNFQAIASYLQEL